MAISLADIAKHNPKVTVQKRTVPRKIVMPWEAGIHPIEDQTSCDLGSQPNANLVHLTLTKRNKLFLDDWEKKLRNHGWRDASESQIVEAIVDVFRHRNLTLVATDFEQFRKCLWNLVREPRVRTLWSKPERPPIFDDGIPLLPNEKDSEDLLSQLNLPIKPGEQYFSAPQVAKMFGVKDPTVYRWIYSGKLRDIRIGGRRRIPKTEIERFANSSQSQSRVFGTKATPTS